MFFARIFDALCFSYMLVSGVCLSREYASLVLCAVWRVVWKGTGGGGPQRRRVSLLLVERSSFSPPKAFFGEGMFILIVQAQQHFLSPESLHHFV